MFCYHDGRDLQQIDNNSCLKIPLPCFESDDELLAEWDGAFAWAADADEIARIVKCTFFVYKYSNKIRPASV